MIHKTVAATIVLTLATVLWPVAAHGADDLPPRALARIGDHRFYHGPGVECAVLSPDGRRVASAAAFPSYFCHVTDQDRAPYERTVVVWDAATGERLRELKLPHGPVRSLAFSPDGKQLAAVCRSGVTLSDVETGRLVRQFEGDNWDGGPHFSADGKVLRVGQFLGPLTAWDLATGKRLRRWKPPAGPSEWVKERETVTDVVPSPDGRVIAWLLYQAPDYSKLPPGVFPPPPNLRPMNLVVVDTDTDKPLYRREFDDDALRSFSFSRDGLRFLTGGKKLRTWDSSTGKELVAVDCPEAFRCVLSPDGRQGLVVDGNSRLRLWDLEARKPSHELCLGLTYINSDTLSPQSFSADGKRVVLATDSTLRVFDTATGKELEGSRHRTPITPRFSDDGRMLFAICDETRCRWDLTAKDPVLRACEPRHAWEGICGNQAVAHSADGRLFVDQHEDRTRVRATATGRALRELEGARGAYFGLFSPDASRVLLWHSSVGRGDDGIQLFDVRTGKAAGEFDTPNEAGRSVVFSPDSRFVAWPDRTHCVHLHDAATGKRVRTLTPARPLTRPECTDACLLFSPDGNHLIVTTYYHGLFSKPDEGLETFETFPTRVLRVADGREVAHFYANPEKTRQAAKISCAACSPDGRLLALAEEESGIIRLVEIASGGVRAELTGHRHGVCGLAFSPDGKSLASGGEDNVVFLWDVTGARMAPVAKDASERELARAWADLAADDARRASVAIASLVRVPGPAATYLSARVRPADAPSADRLEQLIAGLNADGFAEREAASRALARLGERAEAALRRASKAGPPPEMARRIDDLLDGLGLCPPAGVLRELRSIEVLEHVGSSEAVRILEAMARGAPEARQTRDAKSALARLAARR